MQLNCIVFSQNFCGCGLYKNLTDKMYGLLPPGLQMVIGALGPTPINEPELGESVIVLPVPLDVHPALMVEFTKVPELRVNWILLKKLGTRLFVFNL